MDDALGPGRQLLRGAELAAVGAALFVDARDDEFRAVVFVIGVVPVGDIGVIGLNVKTTWTGHGIAPLEKLVRFWGIRRVLAGGGYRRSEWLSSGTRDVKSEKLHPALHHVNSEKLRSVVRVYTGSSEISAKRSSQDS